MLISGLKSVSLNKISNNISLSHKLISFKGDGDSFSSKPEIIKGSINEDELNNILNTVHQQKKTNKSGYTSNIFVVDNKIVKVPIDKTYTDIIKKQLAYGQNLKEYYALSKIQEIDPDIAVQPFGVIKDKDKYYLVEELIEGVHPNKVQLTQGHLSDLLTKFLKLDTNGITNCDLQSGNIFLLGDNKTKLIDFGSFNLITNNGIVVGSDPIPSEMFKNTIYQDTSKDASERFLKTFLNDNYKDIKNLADNPYLKAPSNASNFEFRTLYSYLLNGSEENPLEFFKGYLKLKAENYHTGLKEFLKKLSDNIEATYFSKEKTDTIQSDLKSAVNYEDLIKKVLSNPDDNVVKVELSKLQLRTYLNLGDSLKSPIENSKKLEAAYNQLIANLKEGIKNSKGDKKEYFIQTLNGFKDKFKNYKFVQEQVEIPDNENLIKVLFKQTTDKINDTAKNIKKGGILAALTIALIAGIIGLIVKKNKNTPSIDNISATVLTNKYLSKNIPDTFKEFKR